ncbi:AAA family ATPase [Patescibacteria group bacterium]|nr:AAA family ATPase [Patescibacteria group bacterium]
MNEQELIKEKSHLENVLEKISHAKEVLNSSLDALGKQNIERLKELREEGASSYGFGSNDFDFLLDQLHQKNLALNLKGKYQTLEEYEFLLKEPYFSRIDLHDPKTEKTEEYYIGKFSYTEDKPVVTDWRSKVASVYYRYRYPQKGVNYETPLGLEKRDLELKRTFEIQDGALIKYYNNDLQLDESSIISEKIGKRTGGVLEDIVQTIQESQLDIIEADPRQVCIVQGCVGSGKSTVAIHKLAHIFFNYPTIIRPERCLMITKSQILAGYLSTLFPKLGIFDVNYKTVRDMIYNILYREELGIKVDLGRDQDTGYYNLSRIKTLQNSIKRIHKNYERKILNIFKDPELKSFASFKYSYDETPYENIVGIIEDVGEEIISQKEHLKLHPDGVNSWLHKENLSNLRKILRQANKIKNELINVTLKKVSKDMGINTTKELSYVESLIYLYLYFELVGLRNFRKYEYCVIDEAQDFSLLEYLVLNKMVLRGRFALFGDLNQSLETDSVKNWEEIPQVIVDAKSAVRFKLDENYRSTKQIINFANDILKPYTKNYLPKSINRVGGEPEIKVLNNKSDVFEIFSQDISTEIKAVEKSIGIIVFENSDLIVNDVKNILNDIEIDGKKGNYVELVPSEKISYTPRGVYLMKSDDCKGLEFAKVYVIGLNTNKIKDFSFAKKAFVAVTRAMNELTVYGVK